MSTTAVRVGPDDHGRRMSLDEFDQADVQAGYSYELSRGIIAVTEVPHPRHLAQVETIRDQLVVYKLAHPGRIHRIAGSGECKILVAGLESERHPDVAVYKTPPPEEDIWSHWIPEIVIEVVSPSSRQRDYFEKPEEYLLFGVSEYWILDGERREMLVMRRSRGRWSERTIRPPELYRTRLLPRLEFDCGAVFLAAEGSDK